MLYLIRFTFSCMIVFSEQVHEIIQEQGTDSSGHYRL